MKKESDLRRWFKEKWVDISRKDKSGDHPPCGRGDADKGAYPKCRPSKKITDETPKTTGSLSKRDKKKAISIKRRTEKGSKGRSGSLARKPKYTKLSGENMQNFISKRAKEEYETHSNEEENSMIQSNLLQLADKALILHEVMEGEEINIPEWCQEKIAVASSMIDSIYDYLSSELGFDLQKVKDEHDSEPEWEEEEEDEE